MKYNERAIVEINLEKFIREEFQEEPPGFPFSVTVIKQKIGTCTCGKGPYCENGLCLNCGGVNYAVKIHYDGGP